MAWFTPEKLNALAEACKEMQRVVSKVDRQTALYLQRQIVALTEETVKSQIKEIAKGLEDVWKKIKWLQKLTKAATSPNALERRFGIIADLESRLEAIKNIRQELKKLDPNTQKKFETSLDELEKEIAKAKDKAIEIYTRIAERQAPTKILNAAKRVESFIKRRLPKGAKIERKLTAMPFPSEVKGYPGMLYACHLIIRNVPKFSDPKKKTDIVITLGMHSILDEKKGEDVNVPIYYVSKQLPSPVQLAKVAEKQKDIIQRYRASWKHVLRYALTKAAELDACIIPNQAKKFKIQLAPFRERGFKLGKDNLKVENPNPGELVITYKIGSHKTLGDKKPIKDLASYKGADFFQGKGASEKLKQELLLAVAKMLKEKKKSGLTTANIKIVHEKIDPKKKTITFVIRVIPYPDPDDIK